MVNYGSSKLGVWAWAPSNHMDPVKHNITNWLVAQNRKSFETVLQWKKLMNKFIKADMWTVWITYCGGELHLFSSICGTCFVLYDSWKGMQGDISFAKDPYQFIKNPVIAFLILHRYYSVTNPKEKNPRHFTLELQDVCCWDETNSDDGCVICPEKDTWTNIKAIVLFAMAIKKRNPHVVNPIISSSWNVELHRDASMRFLTQGNGEIIFWEGHVWHIFFYCLFTLVLW